MLVSFSFPPSLGENDGMKQVHKDALSWLFQQEIEQDMFLGTTSISHRDGDE